MQKAVVFDVGRVLYQWQLRTLFEKLIADRDELDWFLANVVTLCAFSLNFGFIRFPVIISSSICLKVELDRVINEVSQCETTTYT